MRTHPVDKLLEQHCYKSAAGLLQLVRFYVCSRTKPLLFDRVKLESEYFLRQNHYFQALIVFILIALVSDLIERW